MSRYVSPKEYTELYPGIGQETVKKMLRAGKLEGYIDEDSDKKLYQPSALSKHLQAL